MEYLESRSGLPIRENRKIYAAPNGPVIKATPFSNPGTGPAICFAVFAMIFLSQAIRIRSVFF